MNESLYTPPRSNLEHGHDSARREFYIVSPRKFAILYLATLGCYGLYWFYRHWSENGRFSGRSVLPVIRALFPFIFVFPLFRRVDKSLRQQELGSMPWWLASAALMVVLNFASIPLSLAGERVQGGDAAVWLGLMLALMFAQIFNLGIVQRQMNIAALDAGGIGNATLTGANWAWIAFGSLLWLSDLAMIWLPES
jgi:hypothetical protein